MYDKKNITSNCTIFDTSGILISTSLVPFSPTNYIRDATGQEKANTIADVDFTFPLNNTLDLGTPFLVQYNHSTTNVRPIGNPDLGNFEITFGG